MISAHLLRRRYVYEDVLDPGSRDTRVLVHRALRGECFLKGWEDAT